MIWFINGKIGFGSPPAGRRFWGADSRFVNGAAEFFGDQRMIFPELDYGFFSTSNKRYTLGYQFAQEQLDQIATVAEVNHLVAFSMGCAFAEGMAEAFGDHEIMGKTVHINPFQAAKLGIMDTRRFVVEYQLTDDPVINNIFLKMMGIAKPGRIKGTTFSISERSSFGNFLIVHRSPIWYQEELFWQRLADRIQHKLISEDDFF